jgi:hypothetical protein
LYGLLTEKTARANDGGGFLICNCRETVVGTSALEPLWERLDTKAPSEPVRPRDRRKNPSGLSPKGFFMVDTGEWKFEEFYLIVKKSGIIPVTNQYVDR